MNIYKAPIIFSLLLFIVFFPRLDAEDRRTIPLDLYMIIDGSESFQTHKNEAVSWINEQVVDRLLLEGDRINIWAAGDSAELVFSGVVSSSEDKEPIKDEFTNLTSTGKSADFSGALRNVESGGDRLSCTMLVTASAMGLGNALTGDNQGLLRWFRSEKYEQWQVLVVGPDIGKKVSQSALEYMNSQQRQ